MANPSKQVYSAKVKWHIYKFVKSIFLTSHCNRIIIKQINLVTNKTSKNNGTIQKRNTCALQCTTCWNSIGHLLFILRRIFPYRIIEHAFGEKLYRSLTLNKYYTGTGFYAKKE